MNFEQLWHESPLGSDDAPRIDRSASFPGASTSFLSVHQHQRVHLLPAYHRRRDGITGRCSTHEGDGREERLGLQMAAGGRGSWGSQGRLEGREKLQPQFSPISSCSYSFKGTVWESGQRESVSGIIGSRYINTAVNTQVLL